MRIAEEIATSNTAPLIQFGPADGHRLYHSHHDALIITTTNADYDVGRMFIDNGSSVDILFHVALKQMDLGDIEMEPVDTTLFEFAWEVVRPMGQIQLPLLLGTDPQHMQKKEEKTLSRRQENKKVMVDKLLIR
ncbi:hypothetical protein BUALT_Bualt01G0114300 [Buddleja alternifolia]|uniref:Uncharacterized protein n=1 Tax=Buddleja alternifolia TaxID=168488 RepID=A0AAV6YH46_9LAMI|nr:hypothetical protein BUALT_Bualt01G0114300 [Buddleja alternifolia]